MSVDAKPAVLIVDDEEMVPTSIRAFLKLETDCVTLDQAHSNLKGMHVRLLRAFL